jgi:hypothetical protein
MTKAVNTSEYLSMVDLGHSFYEDPMAPLNPGNKPVLANAKKPRGPT